MWRPEGWRNPYRPNKQLVPDEHLYIYAKGTSFEAVELGADAMFRALINWGDLYCEDCQTPNRECGHKWTKLRKTLYEEAEQ